MAWTGAGGLSGGMGVVPLAAARARHGAALEHGVDLPVPCILFLLPWWEEIGDGGAVVFVPVSGGSPAVPCSTARASAGQDAGLCRRD
jgi:hypothetical protein